jgi:anti-sigma-K factor RskA
LNIQEYIQSGAIESYVLGLADEDDVAELQRLKLTHPEVAAAVDAAEKWLLDHARAHAVPAADDIRSNLLHMLKTEATKSDEAPRVYRIRPRNPYKYLAAACVILLLVSAAFNFYFQRKYHRAIDDYALVSNPKVIKVPLLGVKGKEANSATLYWDTRNKYVYLDAGHLAKAPAGRQYQLWALVDGKPVDAGVLENCTGPCPLRTVQQAQAFAITLEKTGGSPTPTLSQMYVLGAVKPI